MYYFLYKITNLINNKFYIGVHKTNNIQDGYFGSGKVLKNAIRKHGIENFKKEILEFFDSKEEMYLAEKQIVNKEFVLNKSTYNISVGGNGGFSPIPWNKGKKGLQVAWNKGLPGLKGPANGFYKKTHSAEFYKKQSERCKGKTYEELYGEAEAKRLRKLKSERIHSEEEKNKRRLSILKHYKKVLCIETGEIFDSISAAGRHVNAKSIESLRQQLLGHTKSSYGHTWKYID